MVIGPTELAIQTSFRQRARIICPAVHIVAIPNAGKRGRGAVAQVKREGIAAGFPDVMCLWAAGAGANAIPHIAYVEFKSAKGKMSANQDEWIERLANLGFPVSVQRDADSAIEWLRGLGAPFIDRRYL